MLPLHLALIADILIFVVGMYAIRIVITYPQVRPAWSVSIVEFRIAGMTVSYGRKKSYYDV